MLEGNVKHFKKISKFKQLPATNTKIPTRTEDVQGKTHWNKHQQQNKSGGGKMRLTDAHTCDTQKQTVVQMLLIAVAQGDAPPLPAGTLD